MEWSAQAKQALSRVPSFVRRRVKTAVEEEAARNGAQEVKRSHVQACQRRFLDRMDIEVQGYRLEHCFGPAGCSNRAMASDGLIEDLEALLQGKDLLAFLRAHSRGEVKLHQEFRITLADCPNACSRPQIVDLGIIGAKRPGLREVECSGCSECLQACREGAIELQSGGPQIDRDRCLLCGRCTAVCATGTLSEERSGYRVLLGGKLGRHPRLGRELPGVCGREEVLAIAERCLDRFVSQSGPVKRFGELVDEDFLEGMSASVL